jgi:hypothetical protein
MGLVFVWIAFAVVTALAAQARGRSFLAWLLLGLAFGLFALLAVLVMRNLRTEAQPAALPPPDAAAQPRPRPDPPRLVTDRAAPARLAPPPPPPPPDDAPVAVYRGHPITRRNGTVFALGRPWVTVQAAEQAIDAHLGPPDPA